MKRKFAMIVGVTILVLLAACGGEEQSTNEEVEEASASEQESEVNMEQLIEQLSMNATIDTTEDTVSFKFSLENTAEEPVILGFTSSQQYEVQVTNEAGESVYTFSADKMFTQELTTEELASGDSLEAMETWTGIEEPGEYTATITYLVNTINDQPLEAKPFQVEQTFTIQDTEGTGNDNEQVTEFEGDQQAFRNLKLTGDNGSYTVSGEARVFEGSFMYSVEDGHNVLIEPTPVQVEAGAPAWASFEIKVEIPQEELPDFGTLTMTIFQASPNDGQPVNTNYIPLDRFGEE